MTYLHHLENELMKYLIYGAYGYTGQLIVEEAVSKGHQPVLGGRDREKLEKVAKKYKLESINFGLENPDRIVEVLKDFDLVLHAAGPYSVTAQPMVKACLATNTHYVDITGEIGTFEYIASKDNAAKQAGIVMLPGAGFDVVPTDCMASFLHDQLPDATHLEMGFQSLSKLSRGTALTMTENLSKGGAIREAGKIKVVKNAYQTRQKKVNGKDISFVSIPWGDVSTAFHSTGIPNIILFFGAHPKMIKRMKKMERFKWILGLGLIQNILRNRVKRTVTGPSEELRNTARSYIWGEATNAQGQKVSAEMNTLEGYKLTALTSTSAVEQLLTGSFEPGFYTPSKAFGTDFIKQFGDTTLRLV